jgi:pyruvate/2-oxoglutarate dehydrogenase complex dihydrolipoamide acyltransferase (E2) component
MDENLRFPNRKKKNWDEEPSLGDKLPDAELEEFNSESGDLEPLPMSNYRIVASASEDSDSEPAEPEHLGYASISADADLPIPIDLSAAAEEQLPAAKPPVPPPSSHGFLVERIRKLAKNSTMFYVAAGVSLGVLLGAVIAVASYFMRVPNGRYDMGPVTSTATGLEGHLFIKWDKKLEYRLAVTPSDSDQQARFALAVANSPRPLSIGINLQDSQGFVLCSKEIVLKYDARNAAAAAPSAPDSQAGKTDAAKASGGPLPQETDLARLNAQEAAREQGKDIFRNQIGPDGRIMAINAQGDLPCSADSYEKIASWSLSPDFPPLDEQDELLTRKDEAGAGAERLPAETPAARAKKIAAKAPARLLPFSIEGDDAVVDFDLSRGVIQTRGRKMFLVDKASAATANSSWQDYPVLIHYRCDQTASCTLTQPGVGVLRARLAN